MEPANRLALLLSLIPMATVHRRANAAFQARDQIWLEGSDPA
jgi:hypothetical protein